MTVEGQLRALSAVRDRLRSVGMDFQFKGKRDMAEQLGYKRDLEFEDDYLARYERNGLAAAIVEIPAKATWRRTPRVFEPDDEGGEFEQAVTSLMRQLDAVSVFQRADIMNRIGTHSVVYIAAANSGSLENPIAEGGTLSADDILFLSPFHEADARIRDIVEDETDPRFGMPESYWIDFFDPDALPENDAEPERTVHASRVIHIAEGGLESELVGRSALQRVWNLLDDIDKIAGGSAEMFWQNVSPIFHGEIPPDFDVGTDEEDKLEETEDQLREIMLGLRRVLITQGMDLNQVSGPTPDPRGVWDVLKAMVSASTSIPQRILFGAEEGELASTEDKASFMEAIRERQMQFAEPVILRPWIRRMQAVGALPEARNFEVVWPDLFELTDLERAEIAQRRSRAIRTIAPAGATDLLADIPELRRVVELPDRPEDERNPSPIQEPGTGPDRPEEPTPGQEGPFEVDREVGEIAASADIDADTDVAARLAARARAKRRNQRQEEPQAVEFFMIDAGRAWHVGGPGGRFDREVLDSASGDTDTPFAWVADPGPGTESKARGFKADDSQEAIRKTRELVAEHELDQALVGRLVGRLGENDVFETFAVLSYDRETGEVGMFIRPQFEEKS